LMFAWWSSSIWPDLRTSRRAVQAAMVFLLISPAGYYLGIIDAYLAHCLYASNTIRAVLVRGKDRGSNKEQRRLSHEMLERLNVPFPPAHRLYEQYFREVAQAGDEMRIVDGRRWAQRSGLGDRVLTTAGEYRDGKKYGHWVVRDADGRKINETTYVDGKRHGRWQAWHPDGSRAEDGWYRNVLAHGLWSMWERDGTPVRVTYENGKRIAVSEDPWESNASPSYSP